ncbi:hypothetical protein GCM10007890_32640 [Methylobacterium tardum]|uniref:Uncharacterized protein n=1 Tax=Methylobacterium tardum TaxID=374432 RepID=A0AA37TK83_9HYPH|nr:hypothetical protein GCM10007890_32640 [Methylobacterium tardum]
MRDPVTGPVVTASGLPFTSFGRTGAFIVGLSSFWSGPVHAMAEMRAGRAHATAGSRPSAGMSRIRFKGQGSVPNLSPLQGPPRNDSRLGLSGRFVNAECNP